MTQEPDDRTAAALHDLFAAALQDEPESAVTPLAVVRQARAEEFSQGEARRRRRTLTTRWVAVAAVLGAVAVFGPQLFSAGTSSTSSASSSSSSSSSASAGSSAAAAGTAEVQAGSGADAGAGRPPSAAAPQPGKSEAAGGAVRPQQTNDLAQSGGAAASSAAASAPAASSAASSAAAGSSAPDSQAGVPPYATCPEAAASVVSAARGALPAGTSHAANPARGTAGCAGPQGSGVTFPASSATGTEVTVRVTRVAPGACVKESGTTCRPVPGTSPAWSARCSASCTEAWVYGRGWQVQVVGQRTGSGASGPPASELLPVARAVLAVLG